MCWLRTLEEYENVNTTGLRAEAVKGQTSRNGMKPRDTLLEDRIEFAAIVVNVNRAPSAGRVLPDRNRNNAAFTAKMSTNIINIDGATFSSVFPDCFAVWFALIGRRAESNG